jgi:hypothetical protein
MSVWVGIGIYRIHDVRERAIRELAKGLLKPDDSNTNLNVRVPMFPILINPFKAKPHAYLYSGDFLVGEITY